MRREIEWVCFCYPARLSSGSSPSTALVRSDASKLFMDNIGGIPHVVLEDKSLHTPANIPWSNVASVGWVLVPVELSPEARAEAESRFSGFEDEPEEQKTARKGGPKRAPTQGPES